MAHRISVYVSGLLAAAFMLLGATVPAAAQEFGKNKVQYRTFDWKYIQSDHFDIYFYDSAGVNLAKFTAFVAENALEQIQSHWRYRITSRIPLIVYNSKNDFQQTNVVGDYLPEGVGGVTELFKNRVNVPFEGDWEKFRHVIHHELVHAVINEKFYGGSVQALISSGQRFMLPIWMNEGLAEFESLNGYDIETDMFIRDAIIGGYLPPLQYLDGYFAYRGGQAFYWYVEQQYGRGKIGELLNRCRATGDLDAAFRSAFGKTVEDFSDQWLYDLKKIYWPDVANRKRPVDFAQRATDHKKDESFFNTAPAISPDGSRVAYISDRDGPRGVYLLELNNPRSQPRQLIEGEVNAKYEELHLVTPAIAWAPDNRQIAIAVKSKGKDAIYVVDVKTGDEKKLPVQMDAIYTVNWAPDGSKLAFQGIAGDQSDIYTYDLKTNKIYNLTRDIFSDMDPHWSPDSKLIYFVSDRRQHPIGQARRDSFLIWNYDYNSRDIFSLNTETLQLKRITSTDNIAESSPLPAADGRLLFISNQNGINNVYVLDPKTGKTRPVTNSISGIEQLSVTSDAQKAAFTSWNDDGQDVFVLRSPFEVKLEGDTIPRTTYLERNSRAAAADDDSAGLSGPVTMVTPVTGYGTVKLDAPDALTTMHGPAARPAGSPPSDHTGPPADARTASGDYTVKDYKVKFTPDIIQATGNYSSFYGVQGVAQLLFSDMLGNHQLFIATDLLLDLKNSDFLVSYSYLPQLIDYQITALQSSRFLYLIDQPLNQYVLARFRQIGLTGMASNPFDRFRRLEFGLTGLLVSREMIDSSTFGDQVKLMAVPSISYVFDNAEWFIFNPISGSRFNTTLQASPKFGDNGVGFYTFLGDFRHYIPFGKGLYSLGLRASGGASFGPNPQRFFIGGVQNWLFPTYKDYVLPVENAEDFTFISPGYPLRGFDYGEQLGSKYALANAELRFPLFRALAGGPLTGLLQYASGIVFFDAGAAWTNNLSLTRRDTNGVLVTDQLLMGTGVGIRAYVLGFPLRIDVAWRWNLDSWGQPKYYFSLGQDF